MGVKLKSAIWIAGFSAALSLASIRFGVSREPFCMGHRLTYWVNSFGGLYPEMHNPADVEALSAIGTNAVPFLLDWIRCDVRVPLSRHLTGLLLKRFPTALKPKLIVDWMDENAYYDERCYFALSAAAVFSVLHTNAEAFIPALQAIVANPTNSYGCMAAENALLHLGTNGFAAVIDVIDMGTNLPQRGALLQSSFLHQRLAPVYNRVVRAPPNANEILLQPEKNPDYVVNRARALPVLRKCLQDPNSVVRLHATLMLRSADRGDEP
jgi:hypothetical protein